MTSRSSNGQRYSEPTETNRCGNSEPALTAPQIFFDSVGGFRVGCKHEGDVEKCDTFPSGPCRAASRKQYEKNRAAIGRYTAAYGKKNVLASSKAGDRRHLGRVGAAAELFVRADLLRRGFEVTKPDSAYAKHDLHVSLPCGWKGVQVKASRYNASTGRLQKHKGGNQSPILALVYLPLWKIEYRDGTEPLPPELITELENEIGGFESWQSSCTNVSRAKATRLKSEFTRKTETTNSVKTAEGN